MFEFVLFSITAQIEAYFQKISSPEVKIRRRCCRSYRSSNLSTIWSYTEEHNHAIFWVMESRREAESRRTRQIGKHPIWKEECLIGSN